VTCEEIDQTLDAVGAHARLSSAQMNTVEIGGGIERLVLGIDRHIGGGKRHAVEPPASQSIRLVLRIQPGGEPLHFERQGDPVHRASDELQTASSVKA